MSGPFVHDVDPVVAEIGGVYLWWYGLSFVLGFLGIWFWLRRNRQRMGMTLTQIYSASLYLAIGVLLGGRLVEVVFYEWDFFWRHPQYVPAYWLGGMATHGLLLGAVGGTLLFCWRNGKSFLAMADELVIPGAWIMAMGRIGNFIDGQIAGPVTDVWWGVRFPDLEGFRHPVVLYDGLKNLLLIPFLLWIRSRRPPQGVVFAHFVFSYAFLRIFIDVFREYPVETFGIGTGQVINAAMAVVGLALLLWFHLRGRRDPSPRVATGPEAPATTTLWLQRCGFFTLLLFCPVIPSDWTQDIPARYGQRHVGLAYSRLYPRIEERAPIRAPDQPKQ